MHFKTDIVCRSFLVDLFRLLQVAPSSLTCSGVPGLLSVESKLPVELRVQLTQDFSYSKAVMYCQNIFGSEVHRWQILVCVLLSKAQGRLVISVRQSVRMSVSQSG